jgi:hypothetical protein
MPGQDSICLEVPAILCINCPCFIGILISNFASIEFFKWMGVMILLKMKNLLEKKAKTHTGRMA